MNNSSVGNESRWGDQDFNEHKLTMIICMAVTCSLALLGNGFLSLAIIMKAGEKALSPVQILILHSCLNDILFALLTILPQLLGLITYPDFYGNDILCRLVRYAMMIPMYGSSFHLVAISADRYMAICRPFESVQADKRRRAQLLALGAWTASFILSVPQIFIFSYYKAQKPQCNSAYSPAWTGKIYICWFSFAAWLIPCTASAVFYTCVVKEVWRSFGQNQLQDRRISKPCDPPAQEYVHRLRNSDNRREQACQMERQRTKTVKLTLTIVVSNFLLYSPFCIVNVLYVFFPEQLDLALTTYIMLVGNLNSCVNPWIYVVFNFNQIKATLACGRCREEENNVETGMLPLTPKPTVRNRAPTDLPPSRPPKLRRISVSFSGGTRPTRKATPVPEHTYLLLPKDSMRNHVEQQ